MEDKIQEVVSKINIIKSKPGVQRFPESLKQEILALYRSSEGHFMIAKQLGLSQSTLTKWQRADALKSALPATSAAFKTVSISAKQPQSLRLVLTNGIFVENLSE